MREPVVVGRIVKAFGLRGEVIVAATGKDPSRFEPGAVLFLDEAGRESLTVEARAKGQGDHRLTFVGRSDRTSVEELIGKDLFLDRSQISPPAAGEYYHFQLVGLSVTREDGSLLGKLHRVLDLTVDDLYEVHGPGGEWLIPARKEFIAWVDLEKGEVRLTNRADLLAAQNPREPEP